MPKMKKITREFTDRLIQKSNPVQSKIDQTANDLYITFNLINGMLLLVRYNCKNMEKTYFLKHNS